MRRDEPAAARLQAQHEHLRSDDRLREIAAAAAELTPEQRLEQAWAMSQDALDALATLGDEARARVEALQHQLSPDAERCLRRLAGLEPLCEPDPH